MTNKCFGPYKILQKLDHFLNTAHWHEKCILIESEVLPHGGYDHWPIALSLDLQSNPRGSPFHLKYIWLSHPSFIDQV